MDYLSKFKKLDLKTKKMISWNLSWSFKSAFRWRWLEFEEFKEYEVWEDSRYIDWLVSAREQRLLTKRFVVDKNIKVFFVLDNTSSMNFWFEKKKKDTMIEVFFLLALSSIENWDSVWALIYDEKDIKFFDSKKWRWHIFNIYKNIYENLTRFTKKYKDLITMNSVFSYLNKFRIKDNLIFVLTDKMNFGDNKDLKILSYKNDVVVVNVFDNFENTLSSSNNVEWVIWFLSKIGKWLFIDNTDETKKEMYKNLRDAKIKSFSKSLNSLGVGYLKIDNLTNIHKEFFNFFNKK